MTQICVLLHGAELRGKVVDAAGASIDKTTLELRRVGKSTLLTRFVTDFSGDFRFIDLLPETYEVSFTAAGFIGRKITRTVSKDEQASLGDVVLQVAGIQGCPDEWEIPTMRLERLVSGTEVTGTAAERASLARPLRRAEVILENANHTYRTTTELTGSFLLKAVEPGDYQLRVVQSGLIEFSIDELTVRDGFRTEIDGVLQLPRCPEKVKCEPIKKILRPQFCL